MPPRHATPRHATPRHATPRHVSCAIALSLACSIAAAGESCEDNFSVSGNFVTGKTYRTTAIISNAQARDAFDGAMSFTAGNGFTVQSSDKNAGTISAVQTANKRVPLGILISPDRANTKIAFSYFIPTAVHSPDDAIKKHFCNTVVAATNSATSAKAALAVAMVAVAAPPAPAPIMAAPNPAQPQMTPPPRPVQRGAPVGYAVITDEQKQLIEAALMKNVPNDRIREKVKEAAPSVTWMAEKMGCLNSNRGVSGLNEYASPNFDLASYFTNNYPMNEFSGAKYHEKSICMNVTRVSGWKALADNALEYQVTFKAEDSGETKVISRPCKTLSPLTDKGSKGKYG